MKQITVKDSPLTKNSSIQIQVKGAEDLQRAKSDSTAIAIKPIIEIPVKDAPTNDASIKEIIIRDEPLKETLIKGEPIKETLIKDAPIKEQQSLIEVVPAENNPVVKKSFSNNLSAAIPEGHAPAWFIVAASATGKSHTQTGIPCQDNHYCGAINDKWGIAITSDGAGSAANSHLGSAFVTEAGFNAFNKLVISKEWHLADKLPSTEEWHYLAREASIQLYNQLENFATASKMPVSTLACTLTVVIYSPEGLLVTHIGDGRAGFMNEQQEWKPALTPHKGEEANHTIFITSDKWITDPGFLMSGISVPESAVIKEKVAAFTLLTDGCELHSFDCSVMDAKSNKWNDPNTPSPKFFNPLVKNLRSMHNSQSKPEASNNKWGRFMEAGTAGLEAETDDKTMILGILI